jgi:hypothetical protein
MRTAMRLSSIERRLGIRRARDGALRRFAWPVLVEPQPDGQFRCTRFGKPSEILPANQIDVRWPGTLQIIVGEK